MPKSATSKPRIMRTATTTVKRFTDSWEYAKDNHHSRWDRNWKLYNNKRALVGYQGITNTFVPLPFSTVETLTAALCAGRPSIDFVPQDMYNYILSYYEKSRQWSDSFTTGRGCRRCVLDGDTVE
jgi:hypothetical protein